MFPREHGAYGQILIPTITAMAVGEAGAAAVALAVAGFSVFLAHEPLLVILGLRGARSLREQRAAARRSLLMFGGIALVAGLPAFAALDVESRAALLVPIGLAVCAGALMVYGLERTTAGEVIVGAALASLSLPVALAAGVPVAGASTVAVVFATVFAMATVSVRAVIARTAGASRGPARGVALGVVTALVALLGFLAGRGLLVSSAAIASSPVLILTGVLLLVAPSARRLRTVGWTLVAATAGTSAILISTLR